MSESEQRSERRAADVGAPELAGEPAHDRAGDPDGSGKQHSASTSFAGVGTGLIVLAVLFLLHEVSALPHPLYFLPLLFVWIGVRGYRHTVGWSRTLCIVIAAVGVIFQVGLLSEISPGRWGLLWPFTFAVNFTAGILRMLTGLWPLLLLVGGIWLIQRRKTGGARPTDAGPADRVDQVALFGGGRRHMDTPRFSGGRLIAVCGGVDADLSRAQMTAEEATVEVWALCGGIDLRVPPGWEVVMNAVPIFGGCSTKGTRRSGEGEASPDEPTGRLIVNGLVMFGGVDVTAKKPRSA